MPNHKVLVGLFLFVLAIAAGCSSDEPTARVVSPEDSIIEDEPVFEQIDKLRGGLAGDHAGDQDSETPEVEQQENQTLTESNETKEVVVIEEEPEEEFKFPGTSIVSTQHNISLALDKLDHEIKGDNWGKVIGITATVLNKGAEAFKPRLIVLLYDEADFKEEWLKPKAQIDFDIEKLEIGEHITREAIVNIAFNDLNLTKNFKMILVDADDPGNKAKAIVETDFNAKH